MLVYHRVAPDLEGPHIIPTVSPSVLRAHLEALGELGPILPLHELLHGRYGFALTFDDDYRSHADHVLPLLGDWNVPATFFLSGRSLHDLGPYWWELLEELVTTRGLQAAAEVVGIRAESVTEMVLACEGDRRRQQRLERALQTRPEHLQDRHIRALADAGMAVGFHTLHHQVLTTLDDEELEQAITEGRSVLEGLTGAPIRLFAYPHGKGDRRTAIRVSQAGYDAAWTGWPGPLRPSDDPYLLRRWEPGPQDVDEFLVNLSVRLHRSAPVS